MTGRLQARLVLPALAVVVLSAWGDEGSGDFDGDGRDELLLRHEQTGEWRYYALADSDSEGHALPLPMADAYRFMGIGDFDGNGHDDVLLRRRDNGTLLYYLVQAPGVSPQAVRRESSCSMENPLFELQGIGDLNGDARDDLVLRSPDTGEWIACLMGDAGSELRYGLGATRDHRYVYAGLGDFNGDGMDDLLLRHEVLGTWISYEMRSNTLLRRPALTRDLAFAFEDIGDFNGDGTDDVLLRDSSTGEWIRYAMFGFRPIARRYDGQPGDPAYGRVAIGDFDGDGSGSLLLRHTDAGDWIEWDLSGVTAQSTHRSGLVLDLMWRAVVRNTPNTADGLWFTEDGRIVLELEPDDFVQGNMFDLNGRTLVFTPDGDGGYWRQASVLFWERDVGDAVGNRTEVTLPFVFDFAGESWNELTVHRSGLLAFGRTFADPYWDLSRRFSTMEEYASELAGGVPIIAALYKPLPFDGASQTDTHVASHTDRIAVTWLATEPAFHVHGVAPDTLAGIQAVLYADGRIALSYRDVEFGDGIVGLFQNHEDVKGDLLVSIPDPIDNAVPGHLDLTDVSVYESREGRALIVEFTTRGTIPESPLEPHHYSYRLYVDADEPYWTAGAFWEDVDFAWTIELRWDGGRWSQGGSVLQRQETNRIAMLVDLGDDALETLFRNQSPSGGSGPILASVVADALQYEIDGDGGYVFVPPNDRLVAAPVQLPVPPPVPDLSTLQTGTSMEQNEVFHHRKVHSIQDVACRIVERVGDEFDLLVFHGEFRSDVQEEGSGIFVYDPNVGVTGIGRNGTFRPPCEANRLKGHWGFPVWIKSRMIVDDTAEASWRFARGVVHFAHEFTHLWSAYLSYERDGRRVPLSADGSHWRWELHAPAAFPWRTGIANARTTMGGRVWIEDADGTFMPFSDWDASFGGGPSWLDLYAMGLAHSNEVPDTFVLHGPQGIAGGGYTGEKETVTVSDIVAAMGPRQPSAAEAQTEFNVGFVYLLEPGKTAVPELLALHQAYRDNVVEHWAHTTGGRSEITTVVSAPCASSGCVEAQSERVGGGYSGSPDMMFGVRPTGPIPIP